MTLEEKRAIAIKFTQSIGGKVEALDRSVITDDFTYWAHGVGLIDADTLTKLVTTLRPAIPVPPAYKIFSTTAEGDRVTIEAQCDIPLSNGVRYQNSYHFLVQFRGNKVCHFKEYYDSKYAADSFGPILKNIPHGPGA